MFLIRLLIVGDSGVGKTSLLIRFHENQFMFTQKTTIGVDYKAKECEVDGELVKLQIWDTAGQERFRSMTSAFYSKAQGIIVCFDVSQKESFLALPAWIRDIRREAPRECEIIICATKVDLPHAQWEVSEEEFAAFANSMKLSMFTASAQSGNNVEEVFYALARQVLDKQRPVLVEMRESESRETSVVFNNVPKKKKSNCC